MNRREVLKSGALLAVPNITTFDNQKLEKFDIGNIKYSQLLMTEELAENILNTNNDVIFDGFIGTPSWSIRYSEYDTFQSTFTILNKNSKASIEFICDKEFTEEDIFNSGKTIWNKKYLYMPQFTFGVQYLCYGCLFKDELYKMRKIHYWDGIEQCYI